MSLPTVAIVGRPNVGKSSLFNRFLRKKIAVVDKQPGVTRDRNYAVCDWIGVDFRLVDTGGIVPRASEEMDAAIYDQTEFAIGEADLVLFVVDAQVPVSTIDAEIAHRLSRSKQNTILVANKVDNEQYAAEIYDFLCMGLGEAVPVSATIGLGIGDLLDLIVARLPSPEQVQEHASEAIRVAVVGRPNVGKSSFINKLVGKERLLVTPIAGTTRDAIDTEFKYQGRDYIMVDTAGLRRRYKVHENIEFYTSLRTSRAIDDCDVVVLLIDATHKITSQDQRILQEIISNRRPAVLAINKWDLIEKETRTADDFTKEMMDTLAMYAYLPVIYISALTGQRASKVLSLVTNVHEENYRRISTSDLNTFVRKVVERKHPPARQGKYIKFIFLTQTEVAPPTFVFFANHPKLIEKSYISYLANQIRQQFGFEGVPIRLKFKHK